MSLFKKLALFSLFSISTAAVCDAQTEHDKTTAPQSFTLPSKCVVSVYPQATVHPDSSRIKSRLYGAYSSHDTGHILLDSANYAKCLQDRDAQKLLTGLHKKMRSDTATYAGFFQIHDKARPSEDTTHYEVKQNTAEPFITYSGLMARSPQAQNKLHIALLNKSHDITEFQTALVNLPELETRGFTARLVTKSTEPFNPYAGRAQQKPNPNAPEGSITTREKPHGYIDPKKIAPKQN